MAAADKTITVTNSRTAPTPTGLLLDAAPYGAMLLAAGCAEAAMACSGGMRKPWAPVLGVAVYDLTSKVFSLCVSWLFMRESPALLYVIVPIVVIGYVGSLCGLFSGVRAVRELRHAGIVRN